MIFTWQCPIMFLSYSVLFFLAGLTILVCTPLIMGHSWDAGYSVSDVIPIRIIPVQFALLTRLEVAMVYLATTAVAGGVFMFCSFWIYHYVDLEHGYGDMDALGPEASG